MGLGERNMLYCPGWRRAHDKVPSCQWARVCMDTEYYLSCQDRQEPGAVPTCHLELVSPFTEALVWPRKSSMTVTVSIGHCVGRRCIRPVFQRARRIWQVPRLGANENNNRQKEKKRKGI
jgi:hypothetical protein